MAGALITPRIVERLLGGMAFGQSTNADDSRRKTLRAAYAQVLFSLTRVESCCVVQRAAANMRAATAPHRRMPLWPNLCTAELAQPPCMCPAHCHAPYLRPPVHPPGARSCRTCG